jgi:hypothetical protein
MLMDVPPEYCLNLGTVLISVPDSRPELISMLPEEVKRYVEHVGDQQQLAFLCWIVLGTYDGLWVKFDGLVQQKISRVIFFPAAHVRYVEVYPEGTPHSKKQPVGFSWQDAASRAAPSSAQENDGLDK